MQYLYFNRELSYLQFEKRLLEEAADESNPLFERLKFLSIFSSNLDEFFMVRVGLIKDRVPLGDKAADSKTGLTPKDELCAIGSAVSNLLPLRDNIYFELMKSLSKNSPYIGNIKKLGGNASKSLKNYFKNNVLPLLSPQIIDSKHPFGHLENKLIYIGVSLKSKKGGLYGIIPCPKNIERLYHVPATNCFILLEDIILKYTDLIFGVYKVRSKMIFRVTRSDDLEINNTIFDDDYRFFMSHLIKSRPKLAPVRLETTASKDKKLVSFFIKKLSLHENFHFNCQCPLDFSFVSALSGKVQAQRKAELFFAPYHQKNLEIQSKSLIEEIKSRDILLNCPYESLRPVIDLIGEAARDRDVLSIKMTLYRVSPQSQIVSSLCAAAENGKDVTVVIELSARFDEKSNIAWSALLEDAGCKIFYGVNGCKVHSKMLLITRKSKEGLEYITNIATGNYNEVTSRLYCDLSLLTANREIGEDAALFFQNLTISNLCGNYKQLLVSPFSLKTNIIKLIREQSEKSKNGEPSQIIMKMNSLTDKEIIDELYFASQNGVKIRLIVRGICCLRPGIGGFSENIEVRSIIGRFLEHSRIYCFGKGKDIKLYISSADMMTRNTERRVETAVLILNNDIKKKICKELSVMLSENTKAKILTKSGKYIKNEGKDKEALCDCQLYFSLNTP